MSEPEDNLAALKAQMDRDFKAWMDITAAAEAEAKAAGKPVDMRNNKAYWEAMQAYKVSEAAFVSSAVVQHAPDLVAEAATARPGRFQAVVQFPPVKLKDLEIGAVVRATRDPNPGTWVRVQGGIDSEHLQVPETAFEALEAEIGPFTRLESANRLAWYIGLDPAFAREHRAEVAQLIAGTSLDALSDERFEDLDNRGLCRLYDRSSSPPGPHGAKVDTLSLNAVRRLLAASEIAGVEFMCVLLSSPKLPKEGLDMVPEGMHAFWPTKAAYADPAKLVDVLMADAEDRSLLNGVDDDVRTEIREGWLEILRGKWPNWAAC